MNRKLNHIIVGLVLMYSATAWSHEATMATLNGQDEYKLSGQTECGGEATVKATIKPGERFIASCDEKDCEVTLKSGVSGAIPRNRIRFLPREPLAKLNFESCKKEWRTLQSKPINSSADDIVGYSAKKWNGIPNYYKTLLEASEGNVKAFVQLRSLQMDGEAGEGNEFNLTWTLLHVAGDDNFAKLLAAQSPEFREGYADFFSKCCAPISNPKPYIKHNFPKTYALLYGR